MARATKPPEPPATPPDGADEDGEVTQEERDDFAAAFDGMVKKVASIPDDIGEKLDRILAQGGAQHGHTESVGQPGTATGAGASQGGAGHAAPPIPEPEKKPRAHHWYFRERPGSR